MADILDDESAMLRACELASCCEPVDRAFNVGAVLTSAAGEVLATGFSRELEGNTHAEECCFIKLEKEGRLAEARGGTMFSSMEPCSVRLSGERPCTDRCLEAGVARVVLAIEEPANFVTCEGVAKLRAGGLTVVRWEDERCAAMAAAANAHLSAEPAGTPAPAVAPASREAPAAGPDAAPGAAASAGTE
ncbi:hypothetical protein FNF28_00916 [Cafeteria roenbergensis]|uniref:CMP/dCMP-type deaminase domain-containing protein n=1 Tax=Cafeteria roenbergensis TaxID=33653 RepID=A0A5A8E0X8_CAFRO|nr:hypothetical protein FNF28_00916 [Cafeteria roenbergensis]